MTEYMFDLLSMIWELKWVFAFMMVLAFGCWLYAIGTRVAIEEGSDV